jgi:hypothetical protein
MDKRILAGLVLALALTGTVAAKVTEQNDTGFTVVLEGDISITPDYAWRRFLAIGSWWSDAHSFSGKARNMTIKPEPGGCWCEALPNGGFVRHMDVVYADPGKMLILKGGMGPLLFMGAIGSLTVKFAPLDEGTHVTLNFAVGGHDEKGWKDLSAGVDAVLSEQFRSFTANKAPNP